MSAPATENVVAESTAAPVAPTESNEVKPKPTEKVSIIEKFKKAIFKKFGSKSKNTPAAAPPAATTPGPAE